MSTYKLFFFGRLNRMPLDSYLSVKAKSTRPATATKSDDSLKMGYWNVDGFNEQSSWAVDRILAAEVIEFIFTSNLYYWFCLKYLKMSIGIFTIC